MSNPFFDYVLLLPVSLCMIHNFLRINESVSLTKKNAHQRNQLLLKHQWVVNEHFPIEMMGSIYTTRRKMSMAGMTIENHSANLYIITTREIDQLVPDPRV
jgi:hypothetical protein